MDPVPNQTQNIQSLETPQVMSNPYIIAPVEEPKPSRGFRIIFLFLLFATLLSAAATAYVLMSPAQTQPIESEANGTSYENPFTPQSEPNPFVSVANAQANPFDETTSDNPFDSFDVDTTTTNTDYQNPF